MNRSPIQGLEPRYLSLKITNVREFGAVGDSVANDTIKISDALNSNNKTIFFPTGNFKITNTITVNSGTVTKIIGTKDTVFSVTLASSVDLLILNRNIEFENITFDFNNSYCHTGLSYAENLGIIRLKNCRFINVKDMTNITETILVKILPYGNYLDIDGIEFNNILKKGNGVITDGAGALEGIYVTSYDTTPALANGWIRNIRVKDFHNIDANENILFEDSVPINVEGYSYSGIDGHLKIQNVWGYNFGKRLIKCDGKNIDIDGFFAYSDTDDCLEAIGLNGGTGQESFNISNIQIRGKMYAGIYSGCKELNIYNGIIDIQLPVRNAYNTELNINAFGIQAGTSDISLDNVKITAEYPINLEKTIDTNPIIENLKVSNSTLTVASFGSSCFKIANQPGNGFKTIIFDNVKIKSNVTTAENIIFATTDSILTGVSGRVGHELKLVNCKIEGSAINNYGAYLKYIDDVEIVNLTVDNDRAASMYIGLKIENCQTVSIVNGRLNSYGNIAVATKKCDSVSINGLSTPNFAKSVYNDNSVLRLKDIDRSKVDYADTASTYMTCFDIVSVGVGATVNRPVKAYAGDTYRDTTLGKPIVCKISCVHELDTLTITSGATSAGNITITLNGVAFMVAVTTDDDTPAKVADKIRQYSFLHWVAGGVVGGASVTFRKTIGGTNSAPTFDGGTTGVMADPFAVTTAGVAPAWIDYTGADL